MSFDYDLFVIGGGSGGVRAARVAAGGGAKVALAEEDRYGGTCVIRGCVPKKLMVFASEYSGMVEDAQAYGWDIQPGAFNWDAFKGKLEAELDRLEGIYRNLLKNSGVESFDARAKLVDAHTVELSDGTRKSAKHILIATGGRPIVPEFPGSDLAITSNDIFHLDKLPESILIVGGGYIACEFAGIMNGLGVKTTQYYRGAQILRGFDDEARGLVSDEMCQAGINLHLGTNVIEMAREGDKIRVKATNGDEALFDQVMYATGRAPNADDLGLEGLGIERGRKGEILVDEYSQTGVPSVYAIGDVTDRVNLTPVAIREGMAFVETVFNGNPTSPDHELIPTAIFTQPEMGTVGLSEEDAAKQEPIEVYATSFKPMQQAFAGRAQRVLMKLVVSQATRKVLGCHIVAPGAGEMIQLAGIAVKMGATKEDFDRTVAVHPTMSEELVTMKTPVRTA
ncbi:MULTISPECIES: glutathione-disulfide reductase [Rhodobacterales]|jgi:glutathione reductase (NADPH)|uniref:glutathione-disulfide reductase n=1 Tax=Rhodobacterales TaxID=204455 RepID=UPI00237F873E|nr:glutathione-disulfide reductase [Phaeobacter gallaeciensis]MDE4142080.1 glutathione-disulfide reductase [Phaeobacter gallaeciensis]MDE4150525.1 glutathione-disulfide reductase [Phaeobacter gallaeciensis]MDE4154632.1 glutathione-disulfide reductase [Phaeobacter gallaeciensis]MDE4191047.1 glutathione-disulfide reductase [Phaeobacter gallaeciensis]MDE4199513.1 glutathione-disulfide reductase [Phaeobacter gallaeciensis]